MAGVDNISWWFGVKNVPAEAFIAFANLCNF